MYDVEPATIVGYRLLTLIGFAALWIWVALSRDYSGVLLVFGTMFFAALGWLAPMTYLKRRARHRTERIERELPELIDLLVVTLEAGLSFLASLISPPPGCAGRSARSFGSPWPSSASA
jgi:tight adherence protein C